jgi:hypothetical protein
MKLDLLLHVSCAVEDNLTTYLLLYQAPLQDNESDCGLFLLHYIQKFVEHAPKAIKPSDLDGNWEVLGVVSYEGFIRALDALKELYGSLISGDECKSLCIYLRQRDLCRL